MFNPDEFRKRLPGPEINAGLWICIYFMRIRNLRFKFESGSKDCEFAVIKKPGFQINYLKMVDLSFKLGTPNYV